MELKNPMEKSMGGFLRAPGRAHPLGGASHSAPAERGRLAVVYCPSAGQADPPPRYGNL